MCCCSARSADDCCWWWWCDVWRLGWDDCWFCWDFFKSELDNDPIEWWPGGVTISGGGGGWGTDGGCWGCGGMSCREGGKMEPWLSPGWFLLQIASESFEEGGCGLPSEEQAVEEIRTGSPTECKNYSCLSFLSIIYGTTVLCLNFC